MCILYVDEISFNEFFFADTRKNMWSTSNLIAIGAIIWTTKATIEMKNENSIFRDDQVIFSSRHNITAILVPVDRKYAENNAFPTIFFAVSDSLLDSGSSIYVLEGFAAFEVLEGGKDSTADYGSDENIYFGAKDGLYRYDKDSLSAKRMGVFKDHIIQLQKANAVDAFYILTDNLKMYRLEYNGTVKININEVECARQFVLDSNNNLYYENCKDRNIHVIKSDGSQLFVWDLNDFKDFKLIRPPFVMDECIPLFGDGTFYVLCSNGTSVKTDFHIDERPSAISFDAALYLVAAVNGKIYEFDVMDMNLKPLVGFINEWSGDFSTIIASLMNVKRNFRHNNFHIL